MKQPEEIKRLSFMDGVWTLAIAEPMLRSRSLEASKSRWWKDGGKGSWSVAVGGCLGGG